jgi:branched-chain amino acid transport system substrate-binding protein
MSITNRLVVTSLAVLTGVLLVSGCTKKKSEDQTTAGATPAPASSSSDTPGVTATEIKLGQSMPYSGPASAYGRIGAIEVEYFKMINENGGINGRKIKLISYDDGYVPAKAVEQTRKLVESDGVLAVVNSVGTANNTAVQAYLNQKKVPQLFVATGADKWADPQKYPWTIGWQPSYRTEAKIYSRYLQKEKPGAKVCVLFQNDDFGKDYLVGLHDELGDKFDQMVIKTASYEVTDPTVDSQIVTLQASGCDTLISATTPKAGAGAIRKVYDIGWKPTFFMSNVSISQTAVLKPAGLDKSTGIITAQYLKDTTDPALANDPGVVAFVAFLKRYLPDLDPSDSNLIYGYSVATTVVQVLKQCGNDLSRENLMKQAASLSKFVTPLALPGIELNTSATDFRPFSQMQLARFDGTSLVRFGELVTVD